MMMTRPRPGVSANSGAVIALATMVKRAPATSSTSERTRPLESTASPIRLGAMNRMGKRCDAMGGFYRGVRPLALMAAADHIAGMTTNLTFAPLPSRAAIAVSGPDWRAYLQGLVTQ